MPTRKMPTDGKGTRRNGTRSKGARKSAARSRGERDVERFTEEPLRPGDHRIRPKGRLVVIGGREDKQNGRLILRRVAALTDGGRLVVATLATEQPRESWEEYEQAFRGLGVRHLAHLDIRERADAESPAALATLTDATTVFFTGGDQLRITSLVGDTPLYSRVLEIYAGGGTIAGTSAGAAVLSETTLIGGGGDGSHRIDENLRLAPGFGFAKDLVIDQHFAERGRVSRLMAVVGQNPRIIGVGIDENTAIELRPNRDFRVLGAGGVTILDGRSVTHTNLAEEDSKRTMSLHGITLHLLSQGDVFDLRKREPTPRPAAEVDEELGVHGAADAEREDR